MNKLEAEDQYEYALKLGLRCQRENLLHGKNPYPEVLDTILPESGIAGRVELGVVDMPSDLVVGTKTEGRRISFAANFMPLLPMDTEFSAKWRNLCMAHMSDEGIRDPVKCYEYLGKFYVEEGNKRVSVLKSYAAPTISGVVTRLLPLDDGSDRVRAYYEFVEFYKHSRIYQIQFERPGSYAKLLAALGFDADHDWTKEERSSFLAGYFRFCSAFSQKTADDPIDVTTSEAFLVWLAIYPFADLKLIGPMELAKSLTAIWRNLVFLARDEPQELRTEPLLPEKGILTKILNGRFAHLNVAFLLAADPSVSEWSMGHALGRDYVAKVLGDRVSISTYIAPPEQAEEQIARAEKEGAQLLIATAPSFIGACRKAAVQFPRLHIMHCALSAPTAGVRSYYSRIYEAKFISGAIAGTMSRDGRLGYVANYPIFGVPAGINAFALGALLTNPEAKVTLKWSCLPGNPTKELLDAGVNVISNREPNLQQAFCRTTDWGLYQIGNDGEFIPLASPCWDWGRLYEQIITRILEIGWNDDASRQGRAVTEWWGMRSGVIDVTLSDTLPDGVARLAGILKVGICRGVLDPFHAEIRDQRGILRNDGSKYFTAEQIMNIDWLCENVIGSIPPYESILPMSRNTVRLLGIYRDSIPPEKEEAQL